jgi:hypothetical protein
VPSFFSTEEGKGFDMLSPNGLDELFYAAIADSI